MTQRLTDMKITRVSLVDKGANGRVMAILKRNEEASMTDPADAPAGVIAWLRKALGIAPVAKAAMPTDEAVMREHLTADPPAGHGMAVDADMDMTAMGKKHTAMHESGAEHEHTVSKAATFAEVVAGQELQDALWDSWYTLEDVLWGAIYAYDESNQPLSLEAKTALVAQDLDEFKAYLLAQMAGATVAKSDPGSPDQRRFEAMVRKVGKKISGDRLGRLNTAAEALNSVLAEVAEVVQAADEADEAEETDVEKSELIAAMTEALEPINKRLEALEKSGTAVVKTDPESTEDDGPVTLEGLATVVEKILDRLDERDEAKGVRKSLAGQDGTGEAVKKSAFAGFLS
jgi:hypothetical protein